MGTIWIATTDDLLRILQGLLPRGLVWTRDPARRLTRLLAGLADELVRVHNRARSLMEEADPATTTAAGLLPEWERITGLPEFGYIPLTESDRRAVLAGKLAAQGGQTEAYFEAVALAMGVVVDVENTPWAFIWQVKTGEITRFRCNSPCNAPLVAFSEAAKRVVLAFEKHKPAHTAIWWTGP